MERLALTSESASQLSPVLQLSPCFRDMKSTPGIWLPFLPDTDLFCKDHSCFFFYQFRGFSFGLFFNVPSQVFPSGFFPFPYIYDRTFSLGNPFGFVGSANHLFPNSWLQVVESCPSFVLGQGMGSFSRRSNLLSFIMSVLFLPVG